MKEKRLSHEQEEQRVNLECQIAGLEASAQVLKLAEGVKDYQKDPDLHLPHETVEENKIELWILLQTTQIILKMFYFLLKSIDYWILLNATKQRHMI